MREEEGEEEREEEGEEEEREEEEREGGRKGWSSFETKLSPENKPTPLSSSVRTVPATDAQQRGESPPCPHTWEH